VDRFRQSAANVLEGFVAPRKETRFRLRAKNFARSQRGEIAEWSACTPANLRDAGSGPISGTFFPRLFFGVLVT